MFCHAGCFRRAVGAVLLRRRSVAVIGASFQAKQRAGRVSLFCARFACAGVRGCGWAYRGGAARARDCPRETAGAPRPSVPAGVFFAAPAIAFCRNAERRPPGEPPLSTFILHHPGESQVPQGTENENVGDFSRNTSGNEGRGDGRAGSFMSRHPAPPPQPVGPFSFGCNCRPATQLARTIRSSPRIIRASSVSASVSLSASRAASSGVAQGSSTTRSA